MQEEFKFWSDTEVNHRSLVSWWRGFATGLAVTFGGMVLIGLYL